MRNSSEISTTSYISNGRLTGPVQGNKKESANALSVNQIQTAN